MAEPRAPPGLAEAVLGTSLWEAAYDAELDASQEDPPTPALAAAPAASTTSLHYVTVNKHSKLGIRVRDDDPRLPKTWCVSHFDPLPNGTVGPIEASGVVEIGDFLVRVDDANVEGKDVREVLALIRGAAEESVILTFRRLPTAAAAAGGPYPLHLTEQHRALILRHLLFGSGPGISADRVRFLASRGLPDCDKILRPLIWRLLLGYLPWDRNTWARHLEDQRQIYRQFVADLCVLPEEGTEAGEPRQEHPPQPAPSPPSAAAAKKKLLVPSTSPPVASSTSFDLDASASFAAMLGSPASTHAEGSRPGRSGSLSTSTSTRSTMLGASAAGSQPHFAFARPRTRARYQGDRALLEEIKKDVVRTYPDLAFFLDTSQGSRRYDALLRVLFIYAKVNHGVRYVQGMNELVGALFFVLANDSDAVWAAHAEPDCFFCFTSLMAELRDLYQQGLDEADSGIEGKIGELVDLLARHDPALHKHFAAIGLDARFFALRWITTLFARELLLADTIRVWDSLLADASRSDFVLFFCLAMLEEQRDALLAGSFSFCLKLLQNYPGSTDVQALLYRTEALRQHDARERQQRQQEQEAAAPLSPGSRLRGVLARVASTIEEMEVPAALDSVAVSLSAESRRAGAQLRSSLVSMTRKLVDNLTILDDANDGGGSGDDGGISGSADKGRSAHTRAAPPAAAHEDASDDGDSGEEEEEEGCEGGAAAPMKA